MQKNLGKSTFKAEKYFKLVEESGDEIMIPRGFASSIIRFCKKEQIPFKLTDNREKRQQVEFESVIQLFPYQEEALQKTQGERLRSDRISAEYGQNSDRIADHRGKETASPDHRP